MNSFTPDELSVLQDQDFLRTKARALQKVYKLLTEVRSHLSDVTDQSGFQFPFQVNHSLAKISRGENYESLPYQILDFPANFTQTDIFAFRTMFWWGNHFSAHFLLQGKSLNNYRPAIIRHLDQLMGKDIYVCIADTPWEHHFRNNNYIPIEQSEKDHFDQHPFLKLGCKLEIDQWKKLNQFSSTFLIRLLNSLA
jgi:hypothetical protein